MQSYCALKRTRLVKGTQVTVSVSGPIGLEKSGPNGRQMWGCPTNPINMLHCTRTMLFFLRPEMSCML